MLRSDDQTSLSFRSDPSTVTRFEKTKIWIEGSRPRTLPASVGPALLGGALAYGVGSFSPLKETLAVGVAMFLQIGTNYANDYSDGVRGTDEKRSGPRRLVASKAASPSQVKTAAFISFGVASLLGLVLVILSSWWLIFVGVLSVLAGWYYTGGKRPYGYLGFGEVFTFVFFGLVETVFTFYVQTNRFVLNDIAAGTIEGMLVTAILVANNLRDIPTDRVSNKMTLAVRMGDLRTRLLYESLMIVPYVIAVFMALTYPLVLVTFATAVPTYGLIKVVRTKKVGRDLIPVLVGTSKMVLYNSLLLSLGVILSKVLLSS